jgi:hypothetical protein
MKWISMATAIAAFVGSGAALSSPHEKQPPKVPVPAAVAVTFAGRYTQYAGPLTTDLLLRPDGSYAVSVEWGILPSGNGVGNWRVTGKTLILTPLWQDELGRDWFSHMDAMRIVHEDGDRFVLLRPCDIASLQAEPDLAVYCFLLHEWSFHRTDYTNNNKRG